VQVRVRVYKNARQHTVKCIVATGATCMRKVAGRSIYSNNQLSRGYTIIKNVKSWMWL
jgi:hypothetical protein